MAEHTETPWPELHGTSRSDRLFGPQGPETLDMGRGGRQIDLSTEDYAHARHAVNTHDALVHALENMISMAEASAPFGHELIDQARTARSQASVEATGEEETKT